MPAPIIDSPLPRRVGVIGALAVMVGIIIGSGIFRTPTEIANQIESPGLILLLWCVGGLFSLLGALTFAELACMFPQSGGVYVFIREGFGRGAAFVFGWTYMLITKPSAASGIAVLVGETLNRLLGSNIDPRITTSVIIVAFTVINVLGVRGSAAVAVVLTTIKALVLAAIIILAFTLTSHAPADPAEKAFVSKPLWAAIVAVMSGILWTYDGWSDVGAIAGEVKDPQRNLPRIYLIGTLLVTALYVAINAAYMHVIPLAQMRAMDTVAPETMSRLVGPIGATIVAIAVIVSSIGSTHGSVLTGARVTFQQARDGLLFAPLGRVHPKFQTPATALWVQMVLSLIAAWSLQTFAKLAGSFVFTMWIFYGMAGIAIFILRVRTPDAPRPFRCPGYPIVPALFVASAALMITLSLIGPDWKQNVMWTAVIAAGFPVYAVWNRLRARAAAAGDDRLPDR
jgi:APA family basic amino acid/polyamine antiporter